ncbi:MAG: hypothetical protein F6K42_19925 [Leptolyngbya sp. SIO1D8]|nr:hypothetical protein [Leptolyngbya sp. SIO1D8]
MTDQDQIFRRMVFAHSRGIFAEGNILEPMDLILNALVTPNSISKAINITVETE